MWSQQWLRYLSVAVWQIIPQCTASTKTTICCLSISEGQESGENLPELSGFVVSGELGISCPLGRWRSEGSTEGLCWQRFTHHDWPLPRLLRSPLAVGVRPRVAQHVGFSEGLLRPCPQASPARANDQQEKGRDWAKDRKGRVFYNLMLEMTYLSFCPTRLVTQTNPGTVWKGRTQCMNTGRQHEGAILEADICATMVFVLCFWVRWSMYQAMKGGCWSETLGRLLQN